MESDDFHSEFSMKIVPRSGKFSQNQHESMKTWLVVSNILYFYPYLGK